MVNKHARLGIFGQPSLFSGGRLRPHPFRSLGKSDLSGLQQAEDLAGPSLGSSQECLPKSSQTARTGSVPYGIGSLPGVTPCESLPGWLNVLQDLTRNPRCGPIMRLAISNNAPHLASSSLVGDRKGWV